MMDHLRCTLPYLLFVVVWRVAWGFYAQPEAVQFLEYPSHVTTCEGCGPIVLRCSIAKQLTTAVLPQPEIVWMFNGTVLSEVFPEAQVQMLTNATITISRLTLSTPHTTHSGWYSCEARDGSNSAHCNSLQCVPATTLSNPARVQVLEEFAAMETVHMVQCGTTLLLSCGLPSGTLPTRWLGDGMEVISQQNQWLLSNGDLLVRTHGNSNHTYSCIAELTGSNDSLVNFTLSHHELHTLTPSTSPTNSTNVQLLNHRPILYEGESTTLVCIYNDTCNGTATPVWYQDGEAIDSIRLTSSGQVIQLEQLGMAQSGVYCCVVEGVESCTTLHIISTEEVDEPTTCFIDSSLNSTTLHISSPLLTLHPGLHWLYNGIQLESHRGQGTLNLSSKSAFDLYGIYQSYIEDGDGSLKQLSLTRVMPYGWTNPPSRPSFLEVPRYDARPKAAIRVSWTPPIYKGGLDPLSFNIRSSNFLFGNGETGPVQGNQTIVNYQKSFISYNVRVDVVSESGMVLSEWGRQEPLTVEGLCVPDVKPPPSIITFTCENGRVDLQLSYAGGEQHRTGGCTVGNETVRLPDTNPASLESVPVGTVCSFTAAEGGKAPCDQGTYCHCYDIANLVYTDPLFCNVTGSVHFSQSEYSVNENDSNVEVCVTSQGFGFSVVMEMHPNTSTAPDDYTSESVVLEFTVDTLTLCHNVTVHDDNLLEEVEQFIVTLTTDNPHVDITSPVAVITIQDNDYVNLVLPSKKVYESASNMPVCISVGENLRRELTVRLDTVNGTALEGVDFIGLHTELNFSHQTTAVCVSIDLLDDNVLERDKSFFIVLTSESDSVRGDMRTEVSITDDDSVGVAFTRNSTHLPRNATTVEVCITVTGELERNINVTLAISGDDERVVSELLFNQSQTLICMDLELNSTSQPLHLVLLTSDLSVNITDSGLMVTVEQDTPTTGFLPTASDGLFSPIWGIVILGVGLIVMVTVLLLSLTLIIISGRKRYLQLRYEKQMRIGLKQNKKFIADFEDPVSIAPSPTHHQQEDDVTLYDQFFPSGSHLSSSLSLDKRSYCDSLSQFGITSDDVFEHLQRFSINVLDQYQQDSGIGEYPGGGKSEDFGSAFSGPSISSYVHCGQYNCMCDMCTTSREGKFSRAEGKSPCEKGPSPNVDTTEEHKFLSRTSSLSLPELRSCDNHVITPMTASLSTEML